MKKEKKGKRYGACSINLGDDGGEIKLLCPVKKCLEVYSTKSIYQVYSPESLDPKESNPDMPTMAKKIYNIGTSNWIVARIMVQNYQIIDSHGFLSQEEKILFATHLSDIMNALLSCVNVSKEISDRVSEVEKQVISIGIQSKGNVYTGFPSSDGLEEKITLFLTKAKHAIQRIVDMFNIFYNSGITNSRIDKLVEWSNKNGIATRVIDTLKYFEPVAQYIIDLRNRQEHPKENYTLEFSDFTILANGEISAPLWGMETAKYSIHKNMNVLIKEFVAFIEWLLINIVLSNEKKGPLFEYRVFEIPEEHQDKDCPIKYKVEICFKEKG